MKTNFYINPSYSPLKEFIENIPDRFDDLGEPLHLGRNQVRLVTVNGIKLVIKYFKRITFANRIIYATLRKTKAQRAYEHSELLLSKGITSPMPVAYIDVYNKLLLQKSYYVCLYTEYEAVNEIFSRPIAESEAELKAFARFTYKLHKEGFFHGDYTLSNVLYKFDGEKYDFSLIDNNRMKFKKYTVKKSVKNLKRLKLTIEQMGVIGTEYAKVSQMDGYKVVMGMMFSRHLYISTVNLKLLVKKPLHRKKNTPKIPPLK